MDSLLNNEGLVSCIAYQILKERPCDFSKLSILLSLLMDDQIRAYVMCKDSLFFEDSIFRNERPEFLERIYLEMLPVCLNSMVILIQNYIVETDNNVLKLTEKGRAFADDISLIGSRRLENISKDVPFIIQLTENYSAAELFKSLKLSV
ncbi:hypothetical protein [uncultured Prevotella sp.]|uniref:hypothetical protein n=1 Tax=uncultured Prevotella sp. TaxID=159272 RepID=UPI00261AE321|nr:hypothetical protein [uncultured Prevotella sp.]